MADAKGQAIAPELGRTPSRPLADRDDGRAPCAACGRDHGSVGVHIACLSRAVVRARAELARLRALFEDAP